MEVTLLEALTVYGPLGILAGVGFFASLKMFRTLCEERTAKDRELQKVTIEHRTEMQAMIDRYIRTTTSQVEQYHNLADKIGAVLESLTQRMRR